jgi:hypothetical protein
MREPLRFIPRKYKDDVEIARTYNEAVDIIYKRGLPAYISFDNDLGFEQLEGYDFAKWLVAYMLERKMKFPAEFAFRAHTANPVAEQNIIHYMNSAIKLIGRDNEAIFDTIQSKAAN